MVRVSPLSRVRRVITGHELPAAELSILQEKGLIVESV
jgi:hypothetical protein